MSLPRGWMSQPLGELAEFQNGNSFKSSEWSDRGLPIIRIQNLNSSKNFNFYNGPVDEKWHVRTGDLLFAWAGVKGVSFGPRQWTGPEGVLNQHIFLVKPSKTIDKDWFYQQLRLTTFQIEKSAHGFKDSLLHVPKSQIIAEEILVPPLEEQRKIADILSTWDRAIENLRLLKRKREEYLQLFIDGIFSEDVEPIFPVLANQQTRNFSIGELTSINPDQIKESTSSSEFKFKYIDLSMVKPGAMSLPEDEIELKSAPSRAKRRITFGDILISNVRPNLKGFCIFNVEDGSSYVASTGFSVLRVKNEAYRNLIYFSFFSSCLTKQINSIITGSNYPAMNSSDVEKFTIRLPENLQFASLLGSYLLNQQAEVNLIQVLIDKVDRQKQGLMQQLLTGKVRVKV